MPESPTSSTLRAPGTIAFVIPVYRNERAVTLTYEKLVGLFSGPLSAWQYTMVFVDDGSDDNSPEELREIRARDDRVRVVSFTRNFGQMAALLAGFRNADGDVVLQLSADLQDPIELIPSMVEEWRKGGEVVVAHRVNREDTWTSSVASRIFYSIVRLSYPQIPSGGFDYLLLDRRVVDAFNSIEVRNRFFQGDILWFGYRTTFIPYARQRRTIGKSQYTFSKKLKNSLDAILDSSYLPIRFISAAGVVTALLGFVYAADIVYARFRNQIPVTGWAPIMILLLVIGGVIMVMLGIIGEYIWRIYDEVRGKPNYVVRRIE
jgi:glycosyltransferase involved in cell wall biosynthesis